MQIRVLADLGFDHQPLGSGLGLAEVVFLRARAMPLPIDLVAALPDLAALALVQDQPSVHQHMRGVDALWHGHSVALAPCGGQRSASGVQKRTAAQEGGCSELTH
jgi:hypothetical protein